MSAYDELHKAVEAALQNLESSGVDERTYDCLNEHFASDGDCPLVKLHKQLKKALDIPARNCDVFENETERRGAFIDWHNEAFDLKGSKYAIEFFDLKHDVEGILHEYIDWLFAEANGGAE